MPLSRLAHGYARLASGAQDSEFGDSFATLSEAMTAHLDGVQVVGSKSRGEAFAIKIIDANKPALFAATVAVLDQLGWLDDIQREALAACWWANASPRSRFSPALKSRWRLTIPACPNCRLWQTGQHQTGSRR